MLKKIVTEKLVERSLSMKAWFVDRERNRLKSTINLPLKAKREGWRKPFLGNLKEELVEKITDGREKHHHVPCKLITVWEQQLATEHNLHEFRASRGWLFNFMQRSNLSIRQRTTTGQTIPKDGLAKIANFVKFCKKQRNTFDFALGNIANMDETPPIWDDMPSKTTVDQRVI